MSIGRLIIKEITRGLFGFSAATLIVAVAVAILIVQMTLFEAHDIKTDEVLEAKQVETEQFLAEKKVETKQFLDGKKAEVTASMKAMEDEYRKITLKLGFNLQILPADQNLADFYADRFSAKTMPEDYVRKLSESGIMTVRHLLPSLQQKIRWPEQGQRTIMLIGVRGEIPFTHRDPKKPLIQKVPEGTATLGFEIWDSLGLKSGDPITIMGETYTVGECHTPRRNEDDISIWLHLDQMQELLDMDGEINSIMALKCFCPDSTIEEILKDICTILPNVKAFQVEKEARARDAARAQASKTAQETLAQAEATAQGMLTKAEKQAEETMVAEKKHRQTIRDQQETFAGWLIPSVILAAVATISALAVANARRRLVELALLRAVGFRTVGIMMLLITRALLIGIVGAAIGYAVGFLSGVSLSELTATKEAYGQLFVAWTVPALLIGTPILAALASLPAAVWASGKDPAELLAAE